MGRRGKALILAVAALGCVLAVGCGDKKGQSDAPAPATAAGVEAEASASATPPPEPAVWEGEYLCKKGDTECRDDKFPGDGIYFSGTVFNTIVNADVNVRSFPSTAGANMFQLKKDTKVQILGVSRSGWAFVTSREVIPRRGWISGQFVEYIEGRKLEPISELKIVDFSLLLADSSLAELVVSYKENGVDKNINVRAFKAAGQNFFTFFFDTYLENSHYGVVPGLYVWNFARNQLKHAASLVRAPFVRDGSMALWDWAAFSDDQKFYITREGAGGPPIIFNASNNKRLLAEASGFEIDRDALRNKTVRLDCPSDAVMAKDYSNLEAIDERISDYADEYAGNNPRPDNNHTLVVVCNVNFETGARSITGAEWRQIQ